MSALVDDLLLLARLNQGPWNASRWTCGRS